MKRIFAVTLMMGTSLSAAQAQELTVLTAGDQNMVDYVNDYLGPLFEQQHPGVKVRAVGTGPGDAGSQKILERFNAQQAAGSKVWDTDVAVVHEKFVGPMVKGGQLLQYRDAIASGKLVTMAAADKALGSDVKGYVMPMFSSQTALAYNPALVPNPLKSYDELQQWAAAHPKQFGYNGIKGGASGVSFVMGWIYAYGGDANKLMNGPFEETEAQKWQPAFERLKAFNKNVTLTPGNAGTLDMLSRGEIAIGPVWVDMFYSWKANGQLPDNFKLLLPAPGMPGQPMHYVIPAQAPNRELAQQFVALATSLKVQAQGIVERFNWYPGIDAKYVQSELKPEIWQRLFTDISPQDLETKGKTFPIAPYNTAILNAYEHAMAQ
ncbi:MAG: extracellular solute-binding protein [Symbiopectobacterium sp.]|uniref:ABC transporter substrate-binding protein n=1 Tax=Symbiopectobacterium sp. TaxID=2952789 RepID=UPI0039ED308A